MREVCRAKSAEQNALGSLMLVVAGVLVWLPFTDSRIIWVAIVFVPVALGMALYGFAWAAHARSVGREVDQAIAERDAQ